MNLLLAMLSEDGDAKSLSTMRVCAVLVVLMVMCTWAAVSIQKGEMQALSIEQIALVLGVLGVKAFQRGQEGKSTTETTKEAL